ncbi:MAG: hypothetical protein RL689_888 [Planctomycetota bacterium]|jgi:hypothetical protein
MAKKAATKGGQRTNTTSASGQKSRSQTSMPHSASRMEPSHGTKSPKATRKKG